MSRSNEVGIPEAVRAILAVRSIGSLSTIRL